MFTSFVVLVSQSSVSGPTQSALGATQVETPHFESLHAGVPTLEVQMVPHTPQFSTLTVKSVSQPSATPLMQSALFLSHVIPQVMVAGSVHAG